MTREARIAHLSEVLRKAADARVLAASPIWAEAWNELERRLLDDLLTCRHEEDEKRWRCQSAISVCRDLRRIIEAKGVSPAQLEKELEQLEGAKMRPIA